MITESFIATQDGLFAAFLVGIVTGLLLAVVILTVSVLALANRIDREAEEHDPHSEPYGG